jgi:hypothetical protein
MDISGSLRRRRLIAAAFTSAVLAGSAIAVAATGASGSGTKLPLGGSVAKGGGGNDAPFFAGYVGTPSDGIASASATLTVPTTTCVNTNDNERIAVGPELITAGANNDVAAAVVIDCTNGAVSYQLEAYTQHGGDFRQAISAGNTVALSIAETNSGTTVAKARDLTTGASLSSQQATGTADPDTTFVEGLIPGGVGHVGGSYGVVPNFVKLKLIDCQVNGEYLGFLGATQTNLKENSDIQVSTGNLKSTSQTVAMTFKSGT